MLMRTISQHLRHLATLDPVVVVTARRGMPAGTVPQHTGQG